MRGRNLLFLFGILVVLAGIAFLAESGRRRATHASGRPLFPDLKAEQVDRIRILADQKETILEKQGDSWSVATEGGKPADPKYLTDILEKLPKFQADQVISTNPANHSIFKVDSTGIEVWIDQKGKEIAHFFVGKPAADFASSYVRAANSNSVIQVSEYLPTVFQSRDTWRQKTVFSLDMQNINRYEFGSPKRGSVILAKGPAGDWRMEAPDTGRVETNRVTSALRSFAQLKAQGFADTVSVAAAGLDADTTWIRATLADGGDHRLQIGASAPSLRRYVRSQGSDQIYTVAIGSLNTMMPKTETLLTKPAP